MASNAIPGTISLTIATASGSVTLPNAFSIVNTVVLNTAPLPISEVETGAIQNGFIIVTPDVGSTAPLTTVTYGMVSGGVVQSQAAILPTLLTTDSTLQVDVLQSAARNFGLAITDPGGTAAAITLTIRSEDGTLIGVPVSVPLPAGQQLARFITQFFPSLTVGPAFRGSLNIRATAQISVVGLRFSGSEFSTEPVVGNSPEGGIPPFLLSGAVGGFNAVMFPQFAMGGGWATMLGLVNATPVAMSGRIDVFDSKGSPMPVKLNGATQSTFRYSIPARGVFTLAPRDTNGQSPL